MAGDEQTIGSLSKNVKAEELLKEERRKYDCTPCRVIGGSAFIGLAAYSYWEGMSQLRKNRAAILASKPWVGMRGRRMGIAGISMGLAWMGIYRLFG